VAAEPGVFEAFYNGAVQHPILLWLAAALGLAACLSRPGLPASLRRYAVALAALAILDAWLTSRHIYGIGALPPALASLVPFAFVLAGDYRYLLLWDAAHADGSVSVRPRGLAITAGLALVVPLFAQLAIFAVPAVAALPRALFLVYELAFFALTAALRRWHPRARAVPWLRSLSAFVLFYYGLWATADLALLATGSDWGFALRVVPNLLYYGGLIAALGWLAPAGEARTVRRQARVGRTNR